MIRVKKSFLVLVFLFNLIACSQQPTISTPGLIPSETYTPYVGGTETALASDLASPTGWVAGTETAIAIASASPTGWVPGTETALAALSQTPTLVPTLPPFSTPTPVPLPPGTFSPVFYGRGPFLLVGAVKPDQGWLSGVHAAQYITRDMTYDFYSPNGFFQVPGNDLEFSPVCGNYSMRSTVTLPEPMTGVASGWLSENRDVTNLSVDDPVYMQAVRDWFQAQGNSPVEIGISRILQADLEGDGVNEVLLSASYFKDPSGHLVETGDYSVVLLRKVIGNDVLMVPLVEDYYVTSLPETELRFPLTYTLAGAFDLNQDGTLEVLVDVSRWEGGGLIVYRVDSQNVREVLRTIC